MSIESAKAFLKRVDEDEAFKNRILAIEDVEERLACAKSEGFDFTREEIDGLAVSVAAAASGVADMRLGDTWKVFPCPSKHCVFFNPYLPGSNCPLLGK